MDNTIGFEMSLIVVEAIRGRSASFMFLTATVGDICGGQTNSSILVLGPIYIIWRCNGNRSSIHNESIWYT